MKNEFPQIRGGKFVTPPTPLFDDATAPMRRLVALPPAENAAPPVVDPRGSQGREAGFKDKYPGVESFSEGDRFSPRAKAGDAVAVRQILAGGYKPMLDDPGDARRAVGRTPTRTESANEDDYVAAQAGKWQRDQAAREEAQARPQFDPQMHQLNRQAALMEAQERLNKLAYEEEFFAKNNMPRTPETLKMSDRARLEESIKNDQKPLQDILVAARDKYQRDLGAGVDSLVAKNEYDAAMKVYEQEFEALRFRIAAAAGKYSQNDRDTTTTKRGEGSGIFPQ